MVFCISTSRSNRSWTTAAENLVGHLGSRSPRPGRVLEHERAVESGGLDDGERAIEVLICLAGESHDDVGGDAEIGNEAPGHLELLEESLTGVAAMHGGKHGVAARLEREMELRRHGWGLGHRVGNVLPEVLRMRTGVPNAPDAFDLTRTPQQIGEERLTAIEVEVSAVRVDVLSEQRDLDNPVRRQAAESLE